MPTIVGALLRTFASRQPSIPRWLGPSIEAQMAMTTLINTTKSLPSVISCCSPCLPAKTWTVSKFALSPFKALRHAVEQSRVAVFSGRLCVVYSGDYEGCSWLGASKARKLESSKPQVVSMAQSMAESREYAPANRPHESERVSIVKLDSKPR